MAAAAAAARFHVRRGNDKPRRAWYAPQYARGEYDVFPAKRPQHGVTTIVGKSNAA